MKELLTRDPWLYLIVILLSAARECPFQGEFAIEWKITMYCLAFLALVFRTAGKIKRDGD